MFDQAVQQLEVFIHYATKKYPIDANKRYLLGFSQGAILSMFAVHGIQSALDQEIRIVKRSYFIGVINSAT